MKEKELTKSDIEAEFDRAMNTPSPNPRYGGLTPMDLIQRFLKTPKKDSKARKPPKYPEQSCS